MPFLSFAALLPSDEDTRMWDATPISPEPTTVDVPLVFDFDFERDESGSSASNNTTSEDEARELEPRSPRTPTYGGDLAPRSDPVPPFDVDHFYRSSILPSSPTVGSRMKLHVEHEIQKLKQGLALPSPPNSPLSWIWTCHLCHSRYPLGATRRCLVDGHFYCSGETGDALQRNVKRKKRGRACSSEFDYVGWQEWGNWKKDTVTIKKRAPVRTGHVKAVLELRGCEACEYPSQCRYQRMNKIPDVVMAATSKDEFEMQKDSAASTELKRKKMVASEDKTILTIDIASHSAAQSTILDKEATIDTASPTSSSKMRVKQKRANNDSDTTSSLIIFPDDLVDLAMTITTSTEANKNIENEEAAALDSMVIDHVLDLLKEPKSIADNSDSAESSKYASAAAAIATDMGLSKLTRTKSRKGSRSGTKQSRIGDFFGITK